MSETTKTRKQGGGIRLGLLAGALLLGSMRGVSVPMGKGYGAAHYGRPKGAKHAGNDNPGGRRRTVRKRPVQPEAHGSFLHWSSGQLARIGLRKVRTPEGKTGLRGIDPAADPMGIARAFLALPVTERRAVRLGLKPFLARETAPRKEVA